MLCRQLVGNCTRPGFTPYTWTWASEAARLTITNTGRVTAGLWMREDGLRIDRLLLTTDTTYIPTGFGPVETERQTGTGGLVMPLTRTIVYTYDKLSRLTGAGYSSGESYQYSYDPVGNRLQQIINGDTTDYLYDAANRLAVVDGQAYSFDANGNLLTTGVMTNTWDAANRLIGTEGNETALQPIYNGINDRVGQTVGTTTTTNFALDVAAGLPEVIYTSEGNVYLHLPGVIMTESSTGEVRYLLSDGLGSVRQAMDENGAVVAYNEFDPYGNPVQNGSEPYGYTGEWWENDVGLLHLRARWYSPETGTFLSRDPVESEPPYLYVRGNVVNRVDPTGKNPPPPCTNPAESCYDPILLCEEVYGVPCYYSEPGHIPMPLLPPPSQPFLTAATPTSSASLDSYVATECSKFYFKAPGYAEGYSNVVSVAFAVASINGDEVVYNFATLERATYKFRDSPFIDPTYVPYLAGVTLPEFSETNISYYVNLRGFDNGLNTDKEYSGIFYGGSVGGALSLSSLGGGVGNIIVYSPEVWGHGKYTSTSAGISLPIALSLSKTNYDPPITIQSYVPKGMNAEDKHIDQMKTDIQSGQYSPSPLKADPLQRDNAIDQLQKVYDTYKYFFNVHYNEFRDTYGYGERK